MDDELDERVEHMAKTIYESYGVLIDEQAAYQWDATDGRISDTTKAKFRAIADDALDKIEWTKFVLAPAAACPRCGRFGIWHAEEQYCDLCGSVDAKQAAR